MNKKCIGFSEMTRAIAQVGDAAQTAYSGNIKFHITEFTGSVGWRSDRALCILT